MTPTRGRRILIRVLMVAGTIVAVVAIFAVFANRQVLDAENWSETSSALLEDPTIRTQVAGFLVDEVYANTDVTGELARALPPRLAPLAGPAAGGLRTLAERTADAALGRPRVQELWKQANRLTVDQFIRIAEGDSKLIVASGNALVLDLRTVLVDLVKRLGLPPSISDRIPDDAGRVKLMSGDQVSTAQNLVSAVRGLSLVLPAIAIALLALAVMLAGGRRRQTLLFAGMSLVVAGAIVLLGRELAGGAVVDALAKTEGARPAAEDVWSIGTRMLRDVAQASIVLGVPAIFASLLASGLAPAVAARRAMAPTLRHRPGVAYATATVIVILIVAWGPIPATRLVIPVLLFLALTLLGTAALRRQTAEEFPDAQAGASMAAARGGAARAWRAVSQPRAERGVVVGAPVSPAVATPVPTRLDDLERLSNLRDRGVLTDDEFASEKSVLLATGAVH